MRAAFTDRPCTPTEVADFEAAIRREREETARAVKAFANAVLSGSEDEMWKGGASVDAWYCWPAALRRVARGPEADEAHRQAFLHVWLRYGDHLRSSAGSDLILTDALRKILPIYRGPALTLFRGEGWFNRCRRTYGISWTTDRQVADDFARSRAGDYRAGACLLSAEVPTEGVICVVPPEIDRYAEAEVLVDRRRLGRVNVVGRFAGTM